MGTKINFEEGKNTIEQYYDYMFNSANDVISESMKSDCPAILQEHPWEHLKNYLVACYSQMMENLVPQLRQQFEEFVDSEGGFISFARNTLNSDEAVEYAKHVTDRLLDAPEEWLGRTDMYIDSIRAISTERGVFDDSTAEGQLTEMFQKALDKIQEQHDDFVNRIENEIDENQFVAPLAAVPEILFGMMGAWYESLLNSVPDFMEGARALIHGSEERAKDYSSQAGQQAQSQAQDVQFQAEG